MSQAQAEDRWTVGRLIQWTSDFLRRKGAESPRLDTEVLLAHVLGWPRVQLYTRFEDEIADAPRTAFRELVKKRAEGMPVAYLVGRKEFYAINFRVSPSVLIPRPESEFLVLEFLTAFKGQPDPVALDVGTGSGCLALACLQNHKTARFIATDLSPDALATAQANAEALGLTDRFSTRLGRLYEPVATEGLFDAILSNPPYIRSDAIATLESDVREYEPVLALDGGETGLDVLAPLIQGAGALLKPGGHLLVEFGFDQADEMRKLVESQPQLEMVAIRRDGANHPRVLHARRTS